jgi:hypothetical protein
MKHYVPLVTVFVSGLFGLAVAVVTLLLASRKEEAARRRQAAREAYEELKVVYADALACLEKCIREVSGQGTFPGLQESLAINSARVALVAPEDIVAQSHRVSDLVHEWSVEYRRGQPKPIGPKELNATLISSTDTRHREKASELYPQLMAACTDFANLMRSHLEKVRNGS